MNNAALANGVGRILVGNLQGDDLQAFRIYYAPQPRSVGGVGASLKVNKYAELDSSTSSEANAFCAYRALYVAAGGSYVRVVANISLNKSSVGADRARYIELAKPGAQSNQVSGDGNIDAFDVVSTPVYRDQVASNINGIAISGFKNIPNSLQLAIVRVLNYAGIGKIISSPITITVTVQFQDLSQSDFHWDSVSGGWIYMPGSSKDSSGNPIPENEAAAPGMPAASAQKYVFPGNVYGMLDGFN